MSVQAGIWNFDGRPVNCKSLRAISESMKHRGPDDDFRYVEGSFAMLYRPHYTTVESRRERQPYRSRRGFTLTWDGRLDNRDELTLELRSSIDRDATDVEIVAAAFDCWETACFGHIIGDWGLSIWRPLVRDLIFAVDYMAVRHIFYYLRESQIWWSTDLATLVLVSGDKFDIQDEYVAGYLANEPEAHLTPYRQIREVPPGQFVRISGNRQIVANRYWKFSHRSRIRYKTDAEYEEHFRHVFRQSVRRRLRSDSPILAELSGGLDSSSIVCVADDILAKEGAETSRIDTISFYDKTEPKGDDWNYFPIVEENRGSAGHHIDISKLATSPSSLEWKTFEVQPGRLADALAIEAERAEITRTGGYKVVLSGIGGDEFLGGVPDPRPQIGDLIVQFKFVGLAQQLTEWALVKRQPWIHLLWQAALDLLPPSLGQYFVKEAQVEPWIRKDFAHRTNIAIRQLDVDEHFGFYLPTRRSYIGGVVLMAKRLAKWTPPISSSEETRYPYLDQGLIEFILSIPAEQLLRPGERRSLMRRSLNRIVPKEILDRPTKQFGARTPVMALRNNVTQLQSVFDSPLSSSLGYISHPHFLRALEAADHGKPVHLVRLLKTVSLEMWLRGLAARGLIQVARASPRPATAAESVARASA